jgi:hypothetical protein
MCHHRGVACCSNVLEHWPWHTVGPRRLMCHGEATEVYGHTVFTGVHYISFKTNEHDIEAASVHMVSQPGNWAPAEARSLAPALNLVQTKLTNRQRSCAFHTRILYLRASQLRLPGKRTSELCLESALAVCCNMRNSKLLGKLGRMWSSGWMAKRSQTYDRRCSMENPRRRTQHMLVISLWAVLMLAWKCGLQSVEYHRSHRLFSETWKYSSIAGSFNNSLFRFSWREKSTCYINRVLAASRVWLTPPVGRYESLPD